MDNNLKINYHESKFMDQNGVTQTILVPVVQDLARLKSLPQQFIRDPIAHHTNQMGFSSTTCIPVIDLAQLRGGNQSPGRVTELEKLGREAREWGVFMIRNHGLEPWVLEDVEKVVKGFFDLAFEEKKSSVGTYMSTDNMGYGRNFVKSGNQKLDWIDRLTMKAAPKGATDGMAVWPQNPPNFRSVMENYVKEARKVLDELLQFLAEAFSLDKQTFSQCFDQEMSEINVRVNYYPPSPDPNTTLGITPHSDASALTLLTQFESSNGLQILKDGEWLTVQWPCNTLLVNIGDFMEIISNGLLKSPWHRAVTQSSVDRYSVALFYNPPAVMEIGPVKEVKSVTDEYKNVVVGEYLQHYYKISPTDSKEATLMFAKET